METGPHTPEVDLLMRYRPSPGLSDISREGKYHLTGTGGQVPVFSVDPGDCKERTASLVVTIIYFALTLNTQSGRHTNIE